MGLGNRLGQGEEGEGNVRMTPGLGLRDGGTPVVGLGKLYRR